MKSILTIVTTFILLIPSGAQDQWEIVNEGYKCTIETVDFINKDTGWIAGKEGIFLTTNGSKNWLKLNGDFNFYVIDFYNEIIGWAIVGGGSVMKTLDGGRKWFLQKTVNVTISEIQAVTENIVYAIGDNILKTIDGGTSWEDITPSDGSDFSSPCFINADTGIVIGNKNNIYRTFNGGETWDDIIISEFSETVKATLINHSTGYFLARKVSDSVTHYICKTTDFFSNWVVLSETDLPIQSCHFFDNDVIIAISHEAEWLWDDRFRDYIRMMKSYDGGSTWNYPDSFVPLTYGIGDGSNMMYFTKNTGYYFGRRNISGRSSPVEFIMKSDDQGNTWSCINMSLQLFDVQFMDREKGFVLAGGRGFHCGNGTLFKTEDAGVTWDLIYYYDDDFLSSFLFLNDSLGFLTSFGVSPRALFSTSDGGYSWDMDTTLSSVDGFCLANDSTGWAFSPCDVESGGGIYNTNKGGNEWNLFYASDTLNDPCSIYFLDEKTGWVVGPIRSGSDNYKSLILKYTEEHGWSEIPLATNLPISKISFIDHDIGWISGGYSNYDGLQLLFMRSVDGGENWTECLGLDYLINDFYFENKDHGWAVGEDAEGRGIILETFNSGLDWEVVIDSLSGRLSALHFADGYGWAVGENGFILKFGYSSTSDTIIPVILCNSTELNQPEYIEAMNSEDGVIYMVPSNEYPDLKMIRETCIDSAEVYANTSAKLDLSEQPNGTYRLYARDKANNVSYPHIFEVLGVDTKDYYAKPTTSIYPNPTAEIINVQTSFPGPTSIVIMTMLGQEVYNEEMERNSKKIDMTPFSKGVYFITVRSDAWVRTEKVVKY